MEKPERNVSLEEKLLESNRNLLADPAVKHEGKIVSIFPALKHRNFQLYFAGQLVSLIGFWLQTVGQGFLVFQLTSSVFWVGIVAALNGLPTLFLTIFAGVLIDRVDKRKLLIVTQIFQLVLALILGIAVLAGQANLALIMILAFLTGIVGAVDLPTRQAFAIEMVGKEDLASAISINIGTFNSARFIGPAFAGLLIATIGVGWTFVLNALSFIPITWSLTRIKPILIRKDQEPSHPIQALQEGISFVLNSRQVLLMSILASITAFFAWPYQTLMPALAENVFHTSASGLGTLLASAGAGSFVGAVITSTQSKRESRKELIFAGALISALGLIAFSFNQNFIVAHLILFVIGLGMITQVANVNTTVQTLAPDQMRGRVMAVYLTMFVGVMPLGNTFAGILAETTSSLATVGLGGVVLLLATIILFLRKAID